MKDLYKYTAEEIAQSIGQNVISELKIMVDELEDSVATVSDEFLIWLDLQKDKAVDEYMEENSWKCIKTIPEELKDGQPVFIAYIRESNGPELKKCVGVFNNLVGHWFIEGTNILIEEPLYYMDLRFLGDPE